MFKDDLFKGKRILITGSTLRPRTLREKAKIVVKDLFSVLIEEPSLMPKDWAFLIRKSQNTPALHRLVSDYVSGMTDRYAIQEHSRLTGLQIFR